MNMNNGYVRLPRDFFDDAVLRGESKMVVVIVYLMTRQAYEETELPLGDNLMPGDVLTSRKEIALATGLSEQEVRTVLKKLTATKLLTKLSTKYDKSRKASIYRLSRNLSGTLSTKSSTKSSTTIKKEYTKVYSKKKGEETAKKSGVHSPEKEKDRDPNFIYDENGYVIGRAKK